MKITKIEKDRTIKRVRIFLDGSEIGYSLKLTRFDTIKEIKSFLKEREQSKLDAKRRFKNLPKLKRQLKALVGKEI